jgi:hypothetical protein
VKKEKKGSLPGAVLEDEVDEADEDWRSEDRSLKCSKRDVFHRSKIQFIVFDLLCYHWHEQ